VGAIVYALVWLLGLLAVRISSVAGMAAAVSAPITAAVIGNREILSALFAFALLIVWKHRENIARLRAGTEPRLGKRKT